MDNIVAIKNLRKSYLTKLALNNLNLDIKSGSIVGILGPNGSGKTTLLKIMAGLLKQSSGDILIDNIRPSVSTKEFVSYLPDNELLFSWMKIKDAIEFYSDFFNDFDKNRALELLKFMDLDLNLKVKSLSKGMSEKLNLSLTLSRKAKLYILDEPLGGIDPTTRDKILNAILESFDGESTFIITTHLIHDIERIFDDIVFMSDGNIILHETAENLRIDRGMSIDEIYREVFK